MPNNEKIAKSDYSLGQHIVHFANNLLAKLGSKNAEARILLQNMRKMYAAALKESRMKGLQGEQRNDIMTGEGGRGYGIDESRTNFENDNGYSKLQKRAETDTVYNRDERIGFERPEKISADGAGNRKIERRNLETIIEDDAFSAFFAFVGNEIPSGIIEELIKQYVSDPRMDIYEFSELVA